MTRNTGARPVRTTSPHELAATAAAAVRIIRLIIRIRVVMPLAFGDAWRDENEEFRTVVERGVALEQPAKQRNHPEPGSPVRLVLLGAEIDAADDRRLAVVDQHRG